MINKRKIYILFADFSKQQRINHTQLLTSFWTILVGLTLSLTVSAHRVEHTTQDQADSSHHSNGLQQAQKIDRIATNENQPVQLKSLIKEYSLTGNDALLEEGWAQLQANLTVPQPLLQDFINAAWLAQAEHKFTLALSYLEKVLDRQPNNASAWMLSASIYTVLGKVQQAKQACQKTALLISPIVSIACNARLADTLKQRESAFQAMSRVVSTSRLIDSDTMLELRPWIYSVAADLAASLNHVEDAQRWYQKSISEFSSVQVRAAYADLLLMTENHQTVLDLISQQDQTPALKIRRLQAAKALDHDIETQVDAIEGLFRNWIQQHDYRHAREMAIFFLELADDPITAHYLAQQNIKFQAEPEDRRLLLRTEQNLQVQSRASDPLKSGS